ncbi:hypothetical protein CERSUDRAFT_118818 [Gelatoporia subvermispora B]|uniref:Uncharacterized protein n=1 Tax=Ceriporiopsis subvermispora (strain B) TaxID=914234 RepID=M2QJ86_CERS8|nr:hypothetical protein CERSUDRAFT_118818 [Gelatoporia subvermispora B]
MLQQSLVEDNQRSFEVMFLDGPARGKTLAVDHRYPLSGAAARYLVEKGCCVYQFWQVMPARGEGTESRPWNWELEHPQLRLVWCQRTLKELEHSLRHAAGRCQCYLVRTM